jgi:diacylglycerol kinase (CTP)
VAIKLFNLRSFFPTSKDKTYARRNELHLKRKAFHIFGGLVTLFPYVVLGYSALTMAAGLACALAWIMLLEYLRARSEKTNKIMLFFFGPFLRESEIGSMSGMPFYVASCLFAFLMFPHHVAILSILYLALGDPSSSFFGVLFGRSRLFPNKSLEGTLGGFCVCALVSLGYFSYIQIPQDKLAVMVLLGGFAGAVAELLPLNVDDNFAIPVVSGLFMILVFLCAGLPLS